jgi:hypothetical protein
MNFQIAEQLSEVVRRTRERSNGKGDFVVVVNMACAMMLEKEIEHAALAKGAKDPEIDVERDNVRVGDAPVAVDPDQEAMYCVVRLDTMRI